MQRFFIQNKAFEGGVVKITGSDFNHISHSLRMQIGDQLVINNEDGMEYLAEIQEISNQEVVVRIIKGKKNENEPQLKVTLAQAIPKKNNMDLIIQKCTEIGVSRIIPINTRRTIVKLDDRKFQKRRERWQRIAEEAAKQSRRGKVPTIDYLTDLDKMAQEIEAHDLVLIPWEEEQTTGLRKIWSQINIISKEINSVLIIIGPEGGFAAGEVEFVEKHGGRAVTLGPRILRTETAGFVALTAVLYQAGELD
jgi:16S rRNA (uracil1498-N3)-methyltransferase